MYAIRSYDGDLGYLYYRAGVDPKITGIIQSDKLAAQWYRRAALQGHSRAQYNMAVLHLQGHGVVITSYSIHYTKLSDPELCRSPCASP